MKKIYYIYVCLGVLLLTALPAKAASEAEFGKLAKTYTLHKDGSQEMRVYKELTLFTHAAMNGLYGESFIVYNPAYQELKIHESYTRQKDGKIVKTPENAFVEVLPAAAADAPAIIYTQQSGFRRNSQQLSFHSRTPLALKTSCKDAAYIAVTLSLGLNGKCTTQSTISVQAVVCLDAYIVIFRSRNRSQTEIGTFRYTGQIILLLLGTTPQLTAERNPCGV